MKTKVLIIIGAAAIILSTGFAFTAKTNPKKVNSSEAQTTASTNGGFVLEDADQWK